MKLIYILFKINCSQTVITKTQGLLAMSFEFPILHNGHRSFSIPEECYRLTVLNAFMYNLALYSSILYECLKVFKPNTTNKLAHLVRLKNSRCSEFPLILNSAHDMDSTKQFNLSVNDRFTVIRRTVFFYVEYYYLCSTTFHILQLNY